MSRNTRGRVSIERLDPATSQGPEHQQSRIKSISVQSPSTAGNLGTWELFQLSNQTETKFQCVKICWRHLLLTLSLPPHA